MSVGGKAHKRGRRKGSKPPNLVDPVRNYRLRDWYLAHQYEVNPALVAEDMGWLRQERGKAGRPDETRVLRALGVKKQAPSIKRSGTYRGREREWIEREDAVRLCRALGAYPVDVGL